MIKTAFEKDLESYFPDIYKLNCYGKVDLKLWTGIYELEKMIESKAYGEVKFTFQDGHINHISVTITK